MQALFWAVRSVAKAGTLSIIGVYSEKSRLFPIGESVEKNLTIRMGNCHHRRYILRLVELVQMGAIDPAEILSQREPLYRSWTRIARSTSSAPLYLFLRPARRFRPPRLRGTLAPARRASLKPMAIACLRLRTFLPDRPERSVPRFRSRIARSTFFDAFLPYFAMNTSGADFCKARASAERESAYVA